MEQVDFLIVGQGLAGTCLAWELLDRGASVRVIDRGESMTASKISAGLLNPVIGRNYNLSWRFRESFETAAEFYQAREKQLDTHFFRKSPLVRLFRDENERDTFERKRADGLYDGLLTDPQPDPLVPGGITNERGGIEISRAGAVDTREFLAASRRHFQNLGCLTEAASGPDEVEPRLSGVRWREANADCAVMCLGYHGMDCPCFSWVPFRPAKGEILKVKVDGLEDQRIFNHGNWLFPTPDGHWRTGTTYSWEPLDCEPTSPARQAVEERLATLLPGGSWEVVEHTAAVRPIVHGRKPILGRHPHHARLAIFNGLGSKGALHAPWCARHLAAHLLNGTPIDPALDLAVRFPQAK
jgi:glycine oxidase